MISRSQVAIDAAGGDQYLMIHMASQRTREILQGSDPKITPLDEEKAGSTAIREIEAGLYTIEDYENGSI
jgi:DNA-directed RNA polymerase omega subunit|tara:strand:- start:1487 stop:1696 length:210 start_codon:yes stop_codon:yes gene_type:complete